MNYLTLFAGIVIGLCLAFGSIAIWLGTRRSPRKNKEYYEF